MKLNTYKIETIIKQPKTVANCYSDYYEASSEQEAMKSYELDFAEFIGESNRPFRKVIITGIEL
jgi:S-methylmethionine-dependent homocysteine/selenocysteine methylase